MTKLFIVLLLTIFILPLSVSAQSHADAPIQLVNTFESESLETYDEFIVRVAEWLNVWTLNHKVEACGAITELNGTYNVILTTNNSQLSCRLQYVQEGNIVTGESIHSHPPLDNLGRMRVTNTTRQIDGDFVGNKRFIKVSNHSFSSMDYNVGPGYLVVEGKLFYQNGVNTSKLIRSL